MYESAHGGVALRRLIAPMRVLETMMIPLRTSADQSALMWADVYDDDDLTPEIGPPDLAPVA
jgi:hypothetical protein